MSATQYEDQINSGYLPPESLWLAVEPLLPEGKKGNRGRPPACNRKMFFAIYYIKSNNLFHKLFLILR